MTSKSKKLFKVIDGLRAWNISSSQSTASKSWTDIDESLKSEHLQVGHIIQYGFPYQPTCIAFDPIQRLLAIGTQNGSIRLIGRPGVDFQLKHPSNSPVVQIIFLVNEGSFITLCQDDTIHLWAYKQKVPDIVHSLQFKRERITCGCLPIGSCWFYIGTERGNVHFVNVQKFILSGYIINWNKAIDLSQSSHPGHVVQISENPQDSNKVLIGYSSGFIALWDLRTKAADARFKTSEALHSFYWHFEGKSFISSHSNGILCTWNYKQPQRPISTIRPHSRDSSGDDNGFDPIKRVEWLAPRNGEPFIIFTGGMPSNASGPSITVMRGKVVSVIQMDHAVLDSMAICDSAFPNDTVEPTAVVVLLKNDLVMIDLLTNSYPCFENPYPMDIHEPPVTCCYYLADCPGDLIPALYSVGSRAKRNDRYSSREWPITGGEWGASLCSYPEIIITGHADGTIKFWDASAVTLNALHKVRTAKFFEVNPNPVTPEASDSPSEAGSSTRSSHVVPGMGGDENWPFAIHHIQLCTQSRRLIVAGPLHIALLAFNKKEHVYEIPVVDVSIVYSFSTESEAAEDTPCGGKSANYTSADKQDFDPTGGVYCGPPEWEEKEPSRPKSSLPHQNFSVGSCGSNSSANDKDLRVSVPVRAGISKWVAGYQPDMLCRLGTHDTDSSPPVITTLAFSSSYGLLAFGNDCGIAIVDSVHKLLILSMGTPDLYGGLDPYSRIAWSPNAKKEERSPTELQHLNGLNLSCGSSQFTDRAPPSPSNLSGALERSSAGQGSKQLAGVGSPALMTRSSAMAKGELKRAKSQVYRNKKSEKEPDKTVAEMRDLSRSLSSSMSSLDNISFETIRTLAFMDSYPRKNDPAVTPSLWIGTSLGSVLSIDIQIPDNRSSATVNLSPTGTMFRLRGEMVTLCFLDAGGDLVSQPSEKWEEAQKLPPGSISSCSPSATGEEAGQSLAERSATWRHQARRDMLLSGKGASGSTSFNFSTSVNTGGSMSSNDSPGGPNSSMGGGNYPQNSIDVDQQFIVLCSEKQARVISLPSQSIAFKVKITETSCVLRGQVVRLRNAPVLVAYLANGHLVAFSLPSLRMLMDSSCSTWPPSDRLTQTLCFANNGHLMYFSSPNELQKMTFSNEMCNNLREMQGELFISVEMPEAPKKNFIQNLFSGISSPLDRDELFGETSAGKPSLATASFIPNPKMEKVNSQATGVAAEMARAKQAAMERGERLNKLADQTEEMMNESKSFSKTSSSLASKYEKKDKKWGLPF